MKRQLCLILISVLMSVTCADLVQNGGFDSGSDGWSYSSAWGEYFYTDAGDTIASVGGWGGGWGNTSSNTSIWQDTGAVFEADTVYTMSVAWRQPSDESVESVMLAIQDITSGWTDVALDWYSTSLNNEWGVSTLTFDTTSNPSVVGNSIGVIVRLTSSSGAWLHVNSVSLLTEPILQSYIKCRPGDGGDLASTDSADLTVTVDVSQTAQTISGFGASDCWSAQYVGQWPSAKRNAIADLLFETDIDNDNNPTGIGLSIWRMNLGGGSVRQNNIYDHWRQSDFFYNGSYTGYDWNRCAGQRNFLQMAKARGVEHFIAFSNSPPITMTKNGYAFCDPSVGSTNLASDKRDEYAAYLADVLEHFRDQEGVSFKSVSPINEPEWDWNEDSGNPGHAWQEGCRYSNAEITGFINTLSTELQSRNIDTEIEICESGDITYQYQNGTFEGEHIDQFFNISSTNFIGDKLDGSICGHSYWSDVPADGLISKRQALRAELDNYGLGYDMTEYCILGDYGSGRDLGIDPALHIARTIHFDMTLAEAQSWQWWLGISPYNYKDGLVYCDKSDSNGSYYESKMLWAMGNFSRFVRPGMTRIEVQRSDSASPASTVEDLMVSSYYSAEANVVVTVCVNRAYGSRSLQMDYQNLPADRDINYIIPYVTSASDDLTAYHKLSMDDTIEIPPRSVVTLVGLNVIPGDLEPDGDVDMDDLMIMAGQWLSEGVNLWGDIAPIPDGDQKVDFLDFQLFSEHWKQ